MHIIVIGILPMTDDRYYYFNGRTWQRYDDHLNSGLSLKGADFHDNTAVMVGKFYMVGAAVIRGTR